jgi:hypothetical protein
MGFYFGTHGLWCHDHPGLFVANKDNTFFTRVCDDLRTLNSTNVGQRLLTSISHRWKGVGQKQVRNILEEDTIWVRIEDAGSEHGTEAQDAYKPTGVRSRPQGKRNFGLKGRGTGVTVQYCTGPGWLEKYTTYLGVKTPPFVALAHELIHALHSLSGDNRGLYATSDTSVDADWKHEEARTVGLGIYRDNPMSENALRDELRLPRRETYNKDPFDGMTSSIAREIGGLNGIMSAGLLSHPHFQRL